MQQHKIKESWGYYILIQGSTILHGELHGDVYQDPKFLCFQETLFSITAAKHSYQVSNYNLQHTYWANVVTDYLPLSKDVLAVYPISGILRFRKCHVLQNSANAHRVPEWSYFDLIEKRISNWFVILKIAPHVHRQCPGVIGGLSVSGLLRSLR